MSDRPDYVHGADLERGRRRAAHRVENMGKLSSVIMALELLSRECEQDYEYVYRSRGEICDRIRHEALELLRLEESLRHGDVTGEREREKDE